MARKLSTTGDAYAERKRLYNSGRWKRTRAAMLAQFPSCVHCAADGRETPATVVDHIVGHGDMEWCQRFFEPDGLQCLCAECHSRKTRTEETPESVTGFEGQAWADTPEATPLDDGGGGLLPGARALKTTPRDSGEIHAAVLPNSTERIRGLRLPDRARSAFELLPDPADLPTVDRTLWEALAALSITEGTHAGETFGEHSPPWQERLTLLMASLPELRRCFLKVGKGSGKSQFAAALAVAWVLTRAEPRDQILIASATRGTAKIIFDTCLCLAAELNAGYAAPRFKPNLATYHIADLESGAVIRAVAPQLSAVTGLSPSLLIVDELHLVGESFGSRDGGAMLRQLEASQVKRKRPLSVYISTAPQGRASGIYASTLKKAHATIEAGEVRDFLPWLAELPPGSNPDDTSVWHWANPSLGYTFTLEQLHAQYREAAESGEPQRLRDFRSQHLNVEGQSAAGEHRWLSRAKWDRCADPALTWADVVACRDVVFGIDAGGLGDPTALVAVGRSEGRYLVSCRQWLHVSQVEAGDNAGGMDHSAQYQPFLESGSLTPFSGGGEDLAEVEAHVLDAWEAGTLQCVAVDPYGLRAMEMRLEAAGIKVVQVGQNWKLSPHVAALERHIEAGTLTHDGDPMLAWNVENVQIKMRGSARAIQKEHAAGKIDGVIALLCCIAVLETEPLQPELDGSEVYFV